MAEATFYPDADPEDTSVDGHAQVLTTEQTWHELVVKAGTTREDDGNYLRVIIRSDDTQDLWAWLYRSILLFDLSSLSGYTVTGASLYVYGESNPDNLGISPSINVFASSPASDTAIIPADYNTLGTTPFCDTPIAIASWETGTPGNPNIFALNAAGLAAINTAIAGDGIVKLGLREVTYDVADELDPGNHDPTWSSEQFSSFIGWSVDKGTTYRPKLVVTYEEVVAKPRSHGYIIG